MALFSRKEPVEDEFGEKDVPYRTNEQTLDDFGIYPIRGRTKKAMNIQKFIIMGLVAILFFFFATVLFSSLRANSGVNQARVEIANNASPAFKVRYASLGEEVIRAYYGGKAPVTNLLVDSSWPGMGGSSGGQSASVNVTGLQLIRGETQENAFAEGSFEEDRDNMFTDPVNEILEYTGVIDGRQYSFTVNLIIPDQDDATKLPYLAAPPTMEPMETLIQSRVDASRPDTSGEDPQFAEIALNPSSISRISEWASAYVQDDGEALKLIAGDGNINAEYRGIGGYAMVGTPTIEWAYEFSENLEDPESERMIYSRVSFTMETTVSDQASNVVDQIRGGSDSNDFRPEQVYDILLTDYEEGTPNVSAWVPGGSWYNLAKGMNAVIINPEEVQPTTINNGEMSEEGSSGTTSDSDSPSAPGAPELDTRTSSSRGSSNDDDDSTTSRSGSRTTTSGSNRTSSSDSSSGSSSSRTSTSSSDDDDDN